MASPSALVKGAWPALAHFKLQFLTRQIWKPGDREVRRLAAIYGTIVTSIIAMGVAIP
ncbi:MAG: hypothetical protein WDM77_03900 [Steroidobacteraceae bacterium]